MTEVEKIMNILDEAYRRSLKIGFKKAEISVVLNTIYESTDNLLYHFFEQKEISDEEVKECLSDIIAAECIKFDRYEEDEMQAKLTIKYLNDIEARIYIHKELIQILRSKKIKNINQFIAHIVNIKPDCLTELMRHFEIEYQELKDFVQEEFIEESIIPDYMEGVLTLKNSEIQEGEPKRILGRDEEMQAIWHILSKKTKSNVILIGEPGVGKTAIVELMVYEIVNHKCPEQFEGYQVIQLDMNNLIAGTMYRGMAEERFADIKDFLRENSNVILFIDEIHMMLGAGSCGTDMLDFANSMKPLLAGDNVKVVGATTFDEYEWLAKDGALARRFEKIEVKEPKHSEVYPMIKGRIEELEEYHNVTISKKMVDYIILQASCYYYNIANPDRSLDFVDKAMAATKIRGAKMVSRTDINKVLDVNLKAYENMSLETKTATAYHEAGHCMLVRLSNLNKIYDMVALSIMPTNKYIGLTVYDGKKEKLWTSWTEEFFVDYISMSLAGRVAEKTYTYNLTSGAACDLESANEMAREMVISFGLGKDSENRFYVYEDLWSEKTNNQINKEIKKILKKAEKRAEEIIFDNKTLLEALVDALLKKGILNKKELDKIFAEYPKATKCKMK